MKLKILIIDDHPIFREGLKSLLHNEPDMMVCAEADSCESAINELKHCKADVITMDLSLGDGSGLQLIKQVRAYDKKVKIIISSMHDELLFAERCIRAGANGYINKDQASANIIKAIRLVSTGEHYLSEKMVNFLAQRQLDGGNCAGVTPEELLSNRELEVFLMIGQGLNTRKIASNLNLSSKTIDTHKEHIKRKLNIRDSSTLIQRAVTWVLSESAQHY